MARLSDKQRKAMFARKNKIRIFDSGENFADRYTVVIGKDVFGIGENFNQFSFSIGKGMGFGQLSDKALKDKKVKFENAPEFLQKDIRARVSGEE